MIFIYAFFFLFQLLNTYFPYFGPINPYVFSLLLSLYGLTFPVKKANIKFNMMFAFLIISFLIIYSIKFSISGSFLTTAKAIQFNYGYIILIPGFTVLFTIFPKFKLNDILAATFWIITIEVFIEFVLIRILHVSPGSFTHYPKVGHITLDKATGIYTASRLLGLTGNASVTGVLYSASFALYWGYNLSNNLMSTLKKYFLLGVFLVVFFMVISGSAFFAIVFSLVLIWIQKKGNLMKNVFIAAAIVILVLLAFNWVTSITDAFSNKFSTDYLLLLLTEDSQQGSLPFLLNDLSVNYHWYDLIWGKYFFEWGNPDAVIKTVDYFFVNLTYEFGLLGLGLFLYIIKTSYNIVKNSKIFPFTYLKFGFLVIFLGSLHYPVIVYLSTQIFISALVAIALRDNNLSLKELNQYSDFEINTI